ncbi:MAG: fluoride efflux transporter CrcB [Planctomycetota bacterium]|nr:MAG: fluoride efflux transporter CrcB [Planctomycetota bacterium]
MLVIKLVAVALGGSAGAVLRYTLSEWAQRRVQGNFPAGTLLVNVLGCLVIGALMSLVQARQEALSANMRLFLSVGLLGSLTTFSTFGYQTFELAEAGEGAQALANVGANLALGLAAVAGARVVVLRLFG